MKRGDVIMGHNLGRRPLHYFRKHLSDRAIGSLTTTSNFKLVVKSRKMQLERQGLAYSAMLVVVGCALAACPGD